MDFWVCVFLVLACYLSCRVALWWQHHHPVTGTITPLDPAVWLTNRYYQEAHRWAGAGIPMGNWPPLLMQLADDCYTVLSPTHPELSRTKILQALRQAGRGEFPTLEREDPDAD